MAANDLEGNPMKRWGLTLLAIVVAGVLVASFFAQKYEATIAKNTVAHPCCDVPK
ncbi:MAG: hypothetical protein JWL82_243 [Parcubacteria group bacterium]|nr:hypothetical protein [Parcubacteria group bacterium]